VVNISRGQHSRYADGPAWQQAHQVPADRAAEDNAGTVGDRMAGLAARRRGRSCVRL